jgi:imidazolonepropionase-like amidohydrolase
VRIVVRLVLAAVLLLVLGGAGVWWTLSPPAPLALPEAGVVLHDVTLVEPGRSRRAGRSLRVEGDTIVSVAGATQTPGPYRGSFVLPGLVDLHVHFPPATLPGQTELFAFLFLRHGVTSVRDAGDTDGTSTEPAQRGVEEGRFPGPRVFSCGLFVDGERPLWPNSLQARDAAEARAAVAEVARRGFDCVKAYDGLSPEALGALRVEAAARGLPVIGHVPLRVSYEEAKLDDVQHLTRVPRQPPGEPLPYPEVMKTWADLDESRLVEIVEASLAHDIANTPTLVTADRRSRYDAYDALRAEPDAQLLPRFYRDVIWSPVEGLPGLRAVTREQIRLQQEAFPLLLQTVRRLHEAGARLHTGTDVLNPFIVPGAALHRELRLFVDAGLSPEEALALSMRASAGALPLEGLGELRTGAPADLLIFGEDPTRSLDALESLEAVVARGRLYPREALERQLDAYRRQFESPLYDAITMAIVRRVLAARFSEPEPEVGG